MSEQSRLRWQCRRGMRELDELLLRYLEQRYQQADADEKEAFEAVLSLADPELNSYLLQRQEPSTDAIARVIERILS
ncbi:MAG: succinate dehydrogenase assembly factor 2 [Gammaproteobacteria bacterium]|nr:succinate dehydrogenase assembly factor 2 [Gammaproteobacteria bacterium]